MQRQNTPKYLFLILLLWGLLGSSCRGGFNVSQSSSSATCESDAEKAILAGLDCNDDEAPEENGIPTLEFVEPDGSGDRISLDGNFTLSWKDGGGDATIEFYYATTNSGSCDSGIKISGSVDEDEDSLIGSKVWSVSGIDSGDYYICASLDDQANDLVEVWSEHAITINDLPEWDSTNLVNIDISDSVALSLTNTATDSESVNYSIDDSSTCDDGSWSVAPSINASSGEITGTPSAADVGSCTLVVVASDDLDSSSETINVTIVDLAVTCDTGDLNTTCTLTSASFPMNDLDVIAGIGSLVISNGVTISTNVLETFEIRMSGDVSLNGTGKINGNLTLLAAKNLTIDTTAMIDATEMAHQGPASGDTTGYLGEGGGQAPNFGINYSCGGSGHGARGGDSNFSNGQGGPAYGSPTAPITYGSSGSSGAWSGIGGHGGGKVKIIVTETSTINGTITVDGGDGGAEPNNRSGGGGSAGSIWISTGALAGTNAGAFISADGGDGGDNIGDGGGGSGGRIAIYSTTNTYAGSLSAKGGLGGVPSGFDGGAGTIYEKNTASSGVIFTLVNNDNSGSGLTPVDISSLSVTTFNFNSGAGLEIPAGLTANLGSLTLCTTCFIGSYNISDTVTLNITNDLTAQAGARLRVDNLSVGGDFTMMNGSLYDGDSISITAENFDLQSGSSLNVSGYGFAGGATNSATGQDGFGDGGGLGSNSNAGCGGGANGGDGGSGTSTAGGTAYGSATSPDDWGSGGGGCPYAGYGGDGGGKVKIVVSTTLTIDGSILTDGGDGSGDNTFRAGGGGAGGSIWITTNILAGSDGGSAISADGGDGALAGAHEGGGGAGGRISINESSGSSASTIRADGGAAGGGSSGPGVNGTIN